MRRVGGWAEESVRRQGTGQPYASQPAQPGHNSRAGVLTEAEGHEEVRSLGHQALVSVEDPVRDHSAHGRLAVGRDNCENGQDQSAGAQAEAVERAGAQARAQASEGGRGLTVGVDSLLLGSSHLIRRTSKHVSG